VASTDFRNDIPLSEEILGHISDTYRLLRNTLRFQVSNLYDFDLEANGVSDASLDPIDQWALAKTGELVRQATDAYEKLELHRVYQLCNQFCSVTLSSLYHDILKDRLYTLAPDSPLRRSSQTAIARIFNALVRVLAPILPFTSDEVWSYAHHQTEYADDSILLHGWPEAEPDASQSAVMAEVDQLLAFRSQIYEKLEKLRQSGAIGKSLEATVTLSTPADAPLSALLQKYRDTLAELLIVSQVHLLPSDPGELTSEVRPAEGGRCPRCWRTLESLTGDIEAAQLCDRCNDATAQS
jgi:isoleucyl-tRNA synthetase